MFFSIPTYDLKPNFTIGIAARGADISSCAKACATSDSVDLVLGNSSTAVRGPRGPRGYTVVIRCSLRKKERKPWENYGKTMGKPWKTLGNHRNMWIVHGI